MPKPRPGLPKPGLRPSSGTEDRAPRIAGDGPCLQMTVSDTLRQNPLGGLPARFPPHTLTAMELSQLIAELSKPAAYPYPVPPIEVRQTHISVVFLAGEFVYKIKKPVDLGFLDFSSLEKRRHFCQEEVRLNRRLAPEVYLDVVPVTVGPRRLDSRGAAMRSNGRSKCSDCRMTPIWKARLDRGQLDDKHRRRSGRADRRLSCRRRGWRANRRLWPLRRRGRQRPRESRAGRAARRARRSAARFSIGCNRLLKSRSSRTGAHRSSGRCRVSANRTATLAFIGAPSVAVWEKEMRQLFCLQQVERYHQLKIRDCRVHCIYPHLAHSL